MSALDDSAATLPQDIDPINETSLDSITIEESEVQDQLEILDINKSYGPDEISPQFLKLDCRVLSKPLTRLYNLLLS